MKTYQKWYRRIVAAGLLSLLMVLLTMGVALAEEVTIGNTDDVLPGAVQLVTKSADGKGVFADHAAQAMAEDGSFVFKSNASNLVTPATTAGKYRFYFFDTATQILTALPEFGTDGLGSAQITPDKQWVLLNTFDYTLKIDKVFLYNTATAELMSMKKADGTTLAVKGLSITANGTVVAFSSLEKLVAADTNNLLDVYLWHRDSKAVELASKKSDGTAAGIELFGAISEDGTYVSYIASGSNFPSCGSQTYNDIFRQNVQTGEVQCVSGEVDDSDHEVFKGFQMSSDGSKFYFFGIIDGIQPKITNVYLVNLSSGTTPTVVFDKTAFDSVAFNRLIADGQMVVYAKVDDRRQLNELCTFDVASAEHSCLIKPEGTQDSSLATISPTGRFSVISSWDHSWIGSVADNIAPITNNRYAELFIWDREGVNNAIAGKVSGDDGTTGLADVVLTNGSREKYVTDASGQYTMPYLNAGETYVITPTLNVKTFYPASKTVTAPIGSVNFSTKNPLVMSGFTLDRDAWSFWNRAFEPQATQLEAVFGRDAIYIKDTDKLTKFGELYLDPTAGQSGACFGLVATAGLLYHNDNWNIAPPIENFSTTAEIPDPGQFTRNVNGIELPFYTTGSEVTNFIARYYFSQFSLEMARERKKSDEQIIPLKVDRVKNVINNDLVQPIVFALINGSDQGQCINHAVLPMGYRDLGNSNIEISVYDPNDPSGTTNIVSINTETGAWSYIPTYENTVQYGSSISCNEGTVRLGKFQVLDLSIIDKRLTPFSKTDVDYQDFVWIQFKVAIQNVSFSVTDGLGRWFGNKFGNFVEDLPNAFELSPLNQLEHIDFATYAIPFTNGITATIVYEPNLRENTTFFLGNTVYEVGGPTEVQTDTVSLEATGHIFALRGAVGARTITYTQEFTDTQSQIGVNFYLGESISLQQTEGGVKFSSTTHQVPYTIHLSQISTSGSISFTLTLPELSGDATHIITPNWQDKTVQVEVDLETDGEIDEVHIVGEEILPVTKQNFLPIIQR